MEVLVREDGRERLSSFFASGHAGWAENGEDVVCAAISTILQAAWLGLTEVARVEVTGIRESGKLELRWPEVRRGDVAVHAIAQTAAISLERIALQYPEALRVIRERDEG